MSGAGLMSNPHQDERPAEMHAQGRCQRILVVDDEAGIVATLRIILENAGYEVQVAYDGMEAVTVAERFCPNLLLTDVMMPVMDGVESAIAIRKMLPDCAVLLLSGSAQVIDLLAKARAQGMNFELLAKPVHPSEIMRHIEALCADRMPARKMAG